MSEKRFIWKCDDETCYIFDTVTTASYFYEGIMNLLNEQQATIKQQEKIIKEQTLRAYCQDKEIQKLLQQIKELKET